MIFTPVKTKKLLPPKDSLEKLITPIIEQLKDKTIIAISSKVIAIVEGNCIKVEDVEDKDKLIKSESDLYLERKQVPGEWLLHTIKNGILIPTAGIDESNANGYFILWPKDPHKSAEKICKLLKQKTGFKNIAVLVTDSHSVPLHRGHIGISIANYGFEPLYDYRGKNDLFDRELKITQSNIPDALAAGSVLSMGEGSEQTPIVLITNLPKSIKFIQEKYRPKGEFSSFEVPLEEDLYKPFLSSVPWKKSKKD